MSEYLYELHLHTRVSSACGRITPEEVVRLYTAMGDTGVFITEHFLNGTQVGTQKFREGVRIELLCGGRAYRYLSATWEQNLRIAQSLSAKPTESAKAAERMQGELAALKVRCAKLEEASFAQIAAQMAGRGDVLLFEDDMSPDSVRKLCDAVAAVQAQKVPKKPPTRYGSAAVSSSRLPIRYTAADTAHRGKMTATQLA